MTRKMLEFGSETAISGIVLKVNGSGRLFVIDEERTETLHLQGRLGRKTGHGQIFITLISKSEAKEAVVVDIRENKKKTGDVARRRRRQESHRRIN